MFINVTKEDFTNDIFLMQTDSGDVVVLNNVSEDCEATHDSVIYSCKVNEVQIQLKNINNGIVLHRNCVNIIGMKDPYVSITSNSNDLVGQKLTIENIADCTIEISDTSFVKEQ